MIIMHVYVLCDHLMYTKFLLIFVKKIHFWRLVYKISCILLLFFEKKKCFSEICFWVTSAPFSHIHIKWILLYSISLHFSSSEIEWKHVSFYNFKHQGDTKKPQITSNHACTLQIYKLHWAWEKHPPEVLLATVAVFGYANLPYSAVLGRERLITSWRFVGQFIDPSQKSRLLFIVSLEDRLPTV